MNYRETYSGVKNANKKEKKVPCHLITIGHLHIIIYGGRGYVVIFIRIESKWNYI